MMFKISLLLAACLHFTLTAGMTSAGRTRHGLVGYGVTMYKPPCPYACQAVIESATVNCSMKNDMSGMDMSMSSTPTTEPSCYATDDSFLQTLAYCIKSRCTTDVPWEIEKWWVENAIGTKPMQPDPKETYQQALDKITIKPNMTFNSTSGVLDMTMLISDFDYISNYNAMTSFEDIETHHERYGLVVLLLGFVTPVGLSLLRFLPFPSVWRSRFNAWIIDPPAFGSRHSTPAFFGLELMPTRGQAIFIAYLLIINIVLSGLHMYNVNPNAWYPDNNNWDQLVTYITNRQGILSFANLPLVFLYAGRNNLLLWITDWSHSTFITLHRWVAGICTFQAILHSIIWVQIYRHDGVITSESQLPYWYWGIIATLAMTILAFASVLPLRQKFYELFLAWHVALSILTVAGCYWHILFRFEHQWGYETWIWVVMAVWAFDRVFRFLKLARNGVLTASISVIDDDYVRVTVHGVSGNGHAYLYFPTLTWRVWENHPFSIASTVLPIPENKTVSESDVEKNDLSSKEVSNTTVSVDSSSQNSRTSNRVKVGMTFLVRTQSGITSLLRNKTSIRVLVESAYGQHQDLSEYANLVAIVGGVGITAAVPILRAHVGRSKLYWGVRTTGIADDMQDSLIGIEKDICIGERMNVASIVESELKGETEKTVVLVSGPNAMADEVRNTVTRIGQKEKIVVKLVEEGFSW